MDAVQTFFATISMTKGKRKYKNFTRGLAESGNTTATTGGLHNIGGGGHCPLEIQGGHLKKMQTASTNSERIFIGAS